MDFAKVDGGGISGVELAVLAILVLLVVVAGWAFYQKMSGRSTSDVSGLKLGNRGGPPAE
jgi:hypothetical protein